MKDQIFIADFDGTLTEKDFYWIIIDDYIGEAGKAYYTEWKKDQKIGVEFLNKIFTWYDFTKEEHDDAIRKVAIDHSLKNLEGWTSVHGCDFMILSAGFRHYIDAVLELEGLSHIPVITNEGVFEKGHFIIQPDEGAWYYHPVYGVNKEKVIQHYKKDYNKVYFAGDSEPDYLAAIAADVRFAKGELKRLLEESGHFFYSFETFEDIKKILESL